MNRFRPETHVAQQSRRDKLRVLSNADPSPAPMFSSAGGVLDFAEGSLMNSSTSGIHDGAGWILNCVGGGVGGQMQAPLYPSNLYHPKPPALAGYHDVSGELSATQESQKQQQYRDLHFPSSQLCHTSPQDVFTSSSSTVWNQGLDAGPPPPCPWVDGGNELLLNPGGASVWMNKNSQQWCSDGYFGRMKAERGLASAVPTGTQSLSLSLSSNPLPELQAAQFDERFRQELLAGQENSRASTIVGFSGQGTVGSSTPDPRRCAGPLGPFTGYAAILKSTRFLKPAQQLLDEFCSVAMGSKMGKQCDGPPRSSGPVNGKCDAAMGESGSNGRGGNSVVSSTSIYSSAEGGGEGGASSGAPCHQIHCPEFQQKKAKLLCLQEEVFRRYKQYYQQMQMVISSFESVAGLSAAAPFTSMALKAVSKHFRCLKNAITDQLRHVSKLLGEELILSPSSSKGETIPSLNYIDHSMRKKAVAENSLNFLDHGQPVWRPQRGLPERAVAVLRSWLFDHFLHPYPTDTDKHMLATQTGLSRNQVSNWFINARVRLWKPMVEEIHMLETKGMSGMDLNSSNRNDGKLATNDEGQRSSDQMSEARSGKTVDCSPMEQMLDEESSRAIGQWHREKRTRMEECGIPAAIDGSLMSFAAYQGGMDMGGLGAVSLTLGLRQGEGAQQQQHQQLRRHFASHMVHDFVG